MAPSSSSTKKAARLAQRGKGRRVRFQGGTLFPAVVALVLILGMSLIVYARTSRPAADASPPRADDHWHWAYAFQLCSDEPEYIFAGALEEPGTQGYAEYVATGVHSHNDGVIHWHPIGVNAVGRRANLGIFLDNYGVQLSDDRLEFTRDNLVRQDGTGVGADFPMVYEEGETTCNGEDATLKVVVWDSYADPSSDAQYVTGFNDIRFDRNSKVVVWAFVPNDVDVVIPSWASDLPRLGAIDDPSLYPDGSVPDDVLAALLGDTVPDDAAIDDTAVDDTEVEDAADDDTEVDAGSDDE